MHTQIDTAAQTQIDQDLLRDLLDCEIVLIGGGEAAGNAY